MSTTEAGKILNCSGATIRNWIEAGLIPATKGEKNWVVDMTKEELRRVEVPKAGPKGRGKSRCTCHERDSSFVCSACQAEGFRGHMD